MTFQKKNRFRPLFKQLIKLRDNVQNRQKVLKFKRKKWQPFLKFYQSKLKNFKKFKPLDHSRYFVTKQGTRSVSYKKRFRDTLQAGKKIRIFYGDLLKKYFKKKVALTLRKKRPKYKNLRNIESIFLQTFESRLDIVLYRAKFAPTVRSAKQLILHGKVYVNGLKVKTKAYHLKSGDIINLNFDCLNLYENNTINSVKWSIPPKHLLINYRTLQILFLGEIESNNLSTDFPFNLRLQKVLVNYTQQ